MSLDAISKKRPLEETEEHEINTDDCSKKTVLSERRVLKVPNIEIEKEKKDDEKDMATPTSGGFLAYAKVNPFAAAIDNSSASNTFVVPTKNPFTAAFAKPSTTSIVSPKSPKPNPFSSPSPVHNPFMSFVDKTDGYWTILAKGKDQYLKDINASLHASTNNFASFPSSNSTSTCSAFQSLSSDSDNPFKFDSDSKSVFGTKHNTSHSSLTQLGGVSKRSDDVEDKDKDGDNDGDNDEENGNDDVEDSNENRREEVPLFGGGAADGNVLENGEMGEECVKQIRVKLFRLTHKTRNDGSETQKENSSDTSRGDPVSASDIVVSVPEWVEVGIGPVRILKWEEKVPYPEEKDTGDSKDCVAVGSGDSDGGQGGGEDASKEGHAIVDKRKPTLSSSGTSNPHPIFVFVSQYRLVMRRENQPGGLGTKLLLNILLKGHVSIVKQGDKALRLTCISENVDSKHIGPTSYLLKTKMSEEMEELFDIIQTALSLQDHTKRKTRSSDISA